VHQPGQSLFRVFWGAGLALALASGASLSLAASRAEVLEPQTPSAFLPGGMLGIQLGGSWEESKRNPSFRQLACQTVEDANEVDEVCFFRAATTSRVAGAAIRDGFIARKGLFVKLPKTGMSPDELLGFSRTAPVLLVQLESKSNELAVLYGYLAPVNAFGALTAD